MNGHTTKDIEQRLAAEKLFHDKKYSENRKKNYYELGFKSLMFDDMMSKIGNIENKKVLEFGCGEGWFTKKLAGLGAEVWSFDISDEAVKKTNALLKSHGLDHRAHVEQMAAEKLRYASDTFDNVIGIAILHHLDLDTSIKEIKRILKKGGRAYFMEPLGHNPLLNLYRSITPSLRSKDETPLRFEQFSVFQQHFSEFRHDEYYFLTNFALLWYFVGANNLMLKSRDHLYKADKKILGKFPSLKKYCWYSVLMFEK